MTNHEELDYYIMSCLNSVHRAEEIALESITNGKLTVKEIHFIEAVFKAKAVNEHCFSTIANLLGVTTGTLTTSFSKLEKKGYLYKEQDKNDKRIFYIMPTKLAEMIHKEHTEFHTKMISRITQLLSESEIDVLTEALKKLNDFFPG